MKIFGIAILLQLLAPTPDVRIAGFWAHYEDTLIVTNDKRYYTNADAIRYMCGISGEVDCEKNHDEGFLKGSCSGSGSNVQLRTNLIDTLFVITSDAWTPYIRVPVEGLKSEVPPQPGLQAPLLIRKVW